MKFKKLLIITVLLLLSIEISNAVPPPPLKVIGGKKPQQFIINLLSNLGVPQQWLTFPKILYLFFAPFLSIWIIVYGFLMELRIFRRARWVNLPLSILIAFSTLPLGIFYLIVNTIFTVMSVWSVIVFALMFFAGTWFLFKRRSANWGAAASVAAAYKDDMDNLKYELSQKRLQLIEVRNKIARTSDPKKREDLAQMADKIQNEIQSLRDRIEELAESYRS